MKLFKNFKPSFNLLSVNKNLKKYFCDNEKLRKEEILFYIMNDKYSVKPDKEFRINHTTLDDHDKQTNKTSPKKIIHYGKLNILTCLNLLGKHSITEMSNIKIKLENIRKNTKRKILNKIFPRDYPYSVKEGYAFFSKYTFLSNVCFNTMSFITTQVLINSLNLNIGRASTFAFSAGLNWAIKEGIGQMGKIISYI